VAREYRDLIAGSAIRASHPLDCTRVQDPYSFRCQPQVMGACLDLIRNCSVTLELEANAVTDNPLLFVEAGEVLSGRKLPCRTRGIRGRYAGARTCGDRQHGGAASWPVLVDTQDERSTRLLGREQRGEFRFS